MSRAVEDQHAKRDRHTAGKARRAKTPLQQAAPWFDAWRRRVAELPPELADQLAAQMTRHLKTEIEKLKPRGGGDTQ